MPLVAATAAGPANGSRAGRLISAAAFRLGSPAHAADVKGASLGRHAQEQREAQEGHVSSRYLHDESIISELKPRFQARQLLTVSPANPSAHVASSMLQVRWSATRSKHRPGNRLSPRGPRHHAVAHPTLASPRRAEASAVTGKRAAFGDGTRHQNLGIQPEVEARRAAEGFRAGRRRGLGDRWGWSRPKTGLPGFQAGRRLEAGPRSANGRERCAHARHPEERCGAPDVIRSRKCQNCRQTRRATAYKTSRRSRSSSGVSSARRASTRARHAACAEPESRPVDGRAPRRQLA